MSGFTVEVVTKTGSVFRAYQPNPETRGLYEAQARRGLEEGAHISFLDEEGCYRMIPSHNIDVISIIGDEPFTED